MTDIVEKVARTIYIQSLQPWVRNKAMWSAVEARHKHTIWIPYAKAAIKAHTAALAEAGMVIVPREPTEAMVEAGETMISSCVGAGQGDLRADELYKAMIAAQESEK